MQLHQLACACDSCGWVGEVQTELWLQTLRLAGPPVCLALLAAQDLWAGGAALGTALALTLAGIAGVWLRREKPEEDRERIALENGTDIRLLERKETEAEMSEAR